MKDPVWHFTSFAQVEKKVNFSISIAFVVNTLYRIKSALENKSKINKIYFRYKYKYSHLYV